MKTIIRICALLSVIIPSALSAKKTETVINVIPYPQSVEIGKGTFKGAGANFNCDMAIDSKSIAMIRKFADEITFVSGRTNSFATPVGLTKVLSTGKAKGFIFIKDASMGPEEYSIDILKKSCLVKASAYNGFLYAVQTLKQLTDPAIYSKKIDPAQKFFFPCVSIKDKPRFA